MFASVLLCALLQTPTVRPPQTMVVKPHQLSTAALAAAHPQVMAGIASAATAGRLPAAAGRLMPGNIRLEARTSAARAGSSNFKFIVKLKETATEGVRDFGQMNQSSGSSTTKSVTVWTDGTASARLKSMGSTKPSPFKLGFMEVRYVDVDGYTKPRSGGPGPFAKTVKAGDDVLVSVELSTSNVPVGVYDDELTLDTPERVYRVPLRVSVVMSVVSVKVEKVLTPVLTMAAGNQQSARFVLKNTGNTTFHYEVVGTGGPSGMVLSPVSGALAGGVAETISMPVKAPAVLAESYNGSLNFRVQFKQGQIPVTQVVVGLSVETYWKTWNYQLKTLDGKVVQSATVAASSGGLWAWDFGLKDDSMLTPDAHEMAFCWPGSIAGQAKGFAFKCYTKPGQQMQVHFGGVDPALEQAWPFLGNAAVILNSWDTVTSDPFFKILAAEMAAWVASPLALVEYAANPIKDPTKAYSDWVTKHKLVLLKASSASYQP